MKRREVSNGRRELLDSFLFHQRAAGEREDRERLLTAESLEQGTSVSGAEFESREVKGRIGNIKKFEYFLLRSYRR